jgi:hypothetical protein
MRPPIDRAKTVKHNDFNRPIRNTIGKPQVVAPGGGGGGPSPAKGKKHHKATGLQLFLWAEGMQESGNDYSSINQSSGALGRWQVMPANLPSWLQEAGQPDMSPEQFIDDHAAQNAVAYTILGGYYKQYGASGAAAMWYSGQPNPNATYGDPPVYEYVSDVLAWMDTPNAQAEAGGETVQGGYTSIPLPANQDSWAGTIDNTTTIANQVAVSHKMHADRISSYLPR